jgi:aminopeptidase N
VPVNDHPADRATYSLSVDVPEGTIVVSSGEALDPVTSGGRTSYEFAFRDEMAAYQLPLAIGSFTVTEETVNGRRYWMALPDGVPRDVEASFAYQPEIVSLFEDRFGPYPFDQVGAIVVDTDLPASLETQAAPTYGLSSLDPDAVIIAHELAHQWFGNDVALEQWEDVWLNEGFATFAQLLWIEDHFGAAAYRSQVSSFYEYAKTLPAPAHPPADDLFGPSVYVRGALALVALRDSVGDDAIFSMLRHYVSDHAGRNVVTADFLELVSDDLEEGARPLVESFIDDASIPDLPVIS